MTAFIDLNTFYQRVTGDVPTLQQTAGHFNLIRVENLLQTGQARGYGKLAYYKASLVQGHSMIRYAHHHITIPKHALVFTSPLLPYQWERVDDAHTGYVAVFNPDYLPQAPQYPVYQSPANAVLLLNGKQYKQFLALFERMDAVLKGGYHYKFDLLRALLMQVIHEAQQLLPPAHENDHHSNSHERITLLFTELLERQFPISQMGQQVMHTTPGDFAKHLNVHVNHLNKALKQCTGHTTSQLINSRLAGEAALLLKNTHWTIADIAWSLGFEEPNHFSAWFKHQTGAVPKATRATKKD